MSTNSTTRPATNGVIGNGHDAPAMTNGHSVETRPAPPPPPPPAAAASSSSMPAPAPTKMKQAKRQPAAASTEASKLVAQKIAQLEQDQAGEKDQEMELEKELRKANRELNNQTAKMDTLQKIDHLSRRCTELLKDMKRNERDNIKNKKRADQIQKERDQCRSDLNKTVVLKEKLEKLCRELQKENNKLKNENRTLRANEMSNLNSWDLKYSTLLQKLEDLQDEKDHPKKQVVDVELDELFRQRFKSLIEQYELRELHFHSLMRTKELEVQYNMARYERERKRADSEIALVRRLNEQVQTHSRAEAELRSQLNLQTDKFKQEMEEASKKTRRLEKDNDGLKRKHEAMSQNVVRMAEERAENMRLMEVTKRQLDKLKGIVVLMQRQGLVQQGSNNIINTNSNTISGNATTSSNSAILSNSRLPAAHVETENTDSRSNDSLTTDDDDEDDDVGDGDEDEDCGDLDTENDEDSDSPDDVNDDEDSDVDSAKSGFERHEDSVSDAGAVYGDDDVHTSDDGGAAGSAKERQKSLQSTPRTNERKQPQTAGLQRSKHEQQAQHAQIAQPSPENPQKSSKPRSQQQQQSPRKKKQARKRK